MTIALDLGSDTFRSLRLAGNRLLLRSLPAVYCATEPDRHLIDTLDGLDRSYLVASDRVVVVGETAVTVAAYLETDCLHFARHATSGDADPDFEAALSEMLDRLLTPVRELEAECPVVLPPSVPRSDDAQSHLPGAVCDGLTLRGYRPLLVSSGLAVLLAGGKASSFSGVGANFSAGGIEISVVRQGRELARVALPRPDGESGPFAPTEVDSIVEQAAVAFAHFSGEFRDPVDFVCGGDALRGRTAPPLTAGHVKWHRFPLPIRDVQLVADPELAVVRGLLIHAELERRFRRQAA